MATAGIEYFSAAFEKVGVVILTVLMAQLLKIRKKCFR
jgi:hypothetical protein